MNGQQQKPFDVCVIGGGAAGLMAAASAASRGARVLLLEKGERCARKLRITGKGRCNVTNDCTETDLMAHVMRNARFLYSATAAFPPRAVMDWFRERGIPLKTERGNRVFPESDRAADIAEALIAENRRLGVEIRRARALGILTESGQVTGVRTDAGTVSCRAAILCTGGLSYPKTGSDGDGYRMAEETGHSVTGLRPSLVPLNSPDPDCAAMQGLSLRNTVLTLFCGGKAVYRSEPGEMQFAHFGVTGPLVLTASAYMEPGKQYRIELDLKPGLDEEKLDARLLRMFAENSNRDFKNALDSLLPRLMIPVIVRRSGISPEKKVRDLTRAERAALAGQLKRFPVEISGTRSIDEAIVTAGGVSVREIRPATMESKKVSGLFFAGEILDLDACTGGYNLQIAWETGRTAGFAAAGLAGEEFENE